MSAPYEWRRLTPEQRAQLLESRRAHHHPWHSPPHRGNRGGSSFLVTAACFEHRPHIGRTAERMDAFGRALLDTIAATRSSVLAWCVLPNHYHALVETNEVLSTLRALGRLHGRTSFQWNREESCRGRQVFFRSVERAMRSDGHLRTTMNYVHQNPVRHGYVERWTDWPWSSAQEYLDDVGLDEARRRWKRYPVLEHGSGWDEPGI